MCINSLTNFVHKMPQLLGGKFFAADLTCQKDGTWEVYIWEKNINSSDEVCNMISGNFSTPESALKAAFEISEETREKSENEIPLRALVLDDESWDFLKRLLQHEKKHISDKCDTPVLDGLLEILDNNK